jgi:hypothetical protein
MANNYLKNVEKLKYSGTPVGNQNWIRKENKSILNKWEIRAVIKFSPFCSRLP